MRIHLSYVYVNCCFEKPIPSVFPSLDVTPTLNPQLTQFCTDLTGISQDMVTDQPVLTAVLNDFDKWLNKENLLEPTVKFIFVTCGDWDLHKMLPSQCDHFRIPRARYFDRWINIKTSFQDATGKYVKSGMMGMLHALNIQHTGKHHSGIDDCTNIAKVLKVLAQRGYVYGENRKK